MGVDYNLFWTLNPRKLQPFIKSFEMKQKINIETINYQTWLQGIYFGRAVVATLDKNVEYFDKPIDFDKYSNENVSEEKTKEEIMATKFEVLSIMFNRSLEKEGEIN